MRTRSCELLGSQALLAVVPLSQAGMPLPDEVVWFFRYT